MIIIKIVGGLASQLHEYAIGRALSLKHNTELKLDISWFDNIPSSDTIREYQLDKYNIVATIATEKEIKQFKPNRYLIKVSNKIRKYTKQKINFRNYCNESFISLENIKDIRHFYVENTKNFEEFQSLMECQYNIIPNSGFSWFSSCLNKNQNKIVFSPISWIKNKELNEKFIKTMVDKFTIFMDHLK